jgi:UDP-2,4-diacetamido-2,4,6-trideoxy-beta-L-altropyranose hydrolase
MSSIAFRTTAGKGIGFGHLRRCLTLAGELAARGFEPRFWLDGDAAALEVVRAAGYVPVAVSGEAREPGWSLQQVARERPAALVADSYALDEAYFRALRPEVPLLVIDDLADRTLEADLVQNGAVDAACLPYRLGANCRTLFGPAYALLRPSFRDLRRPVAFRTAVERVLVTLGGADPAGHTDAVVRHLLGALPEGVVIDVVLGPLFGAAETLEAFALAHPGRIRLHRALPDLAPLLREADLAVSAGGQTTFELAAAGVPAVALELADNQRVLLAGFARAGTLHAVGQAAAPEMGQRLTQAVARLCQDPALRRRMSEAGPALVDGRGAERVAMALIEAVSGVTPARSA